MSSFLSSVSGQFGKSLILGIFFPTALFVVLGWMFLVPLFPSEWTPLTTLATLDPQWQLATITLLTVVLSGVLYNLNIPLTRFYEGYPWMNTTFGKRQQNHYVEKRNLSQVRYRRLLVLGTAFPGDSQRQKVRAEWNAEGLQLNTEWPQVYEVLPTRLGNVIRSFEEYSDRQYGIDAITLWPRLIAVLDDKYAAAIDDAKITFDFMLNSSVLSAGLAFAILVIGLLYPARIASLNLFAAYIWLLEVMTFGALSVLFYYGAIDRASAWGDSVKGAFDLYKSDLLKKLGYKAYATRMEERDLWKTLSSQMRLGDKPTGGPRLDYEPSMPPTFASINGDTANLQVTRGLRNRPSGAGATVVLQVKNTSTTKDLTNIKLTDTLPSGYDYEWGSASLGDHPATVSGIGPYVFYIGDLAHNAEVTITYGLLSRNTDRGKSSRANDQ